MNRENAMKLNWFAVGAIAGAIGVALGAFGAHALKSRVGPLYLIEK